MARPMPVLPLVASTIVCPGLSSPRRSASSITPRARRSFTEPIGLKDSTLTYRLTPAGAQLVDADHRRVADGVQNVVESFAHVLPPGVLRPLPGIMSAAPTGILKRRSRIPGPQCDPAAAPVPASPPAPDLSGLCLSHLITSPQAGRYSLLRGSFPARQQRWSCPGRRRPSEGAPCRR